MISGGTIMIIGASQALFFVLLIATKKRKSRADLFLITYLILLIVHLMYYFCMFFFPADMPKTLGVLGFSLVILHTPFFFLYVRSLADQTAVNAKEIFFHLLPYIGLNVVILAAVAIGALELSPRYGFLGIYRSDYQIFYYSGQFLAIVTVGYIIWGFWLLRLYRQKIDKVNSNLTAYKWMQFLVSSFLVYFLAIYFVLVSSLDGQLVDPKHVFYYVSFIIMAYVFVLGFLGIKQREVFSDIQPDINVRDAQSKYAKSGLTTETINEIEVKLRSIMENDQVYIDPEISLPDLASKLEVKPTYLSQVINQQFDQNFFDFINKYRVEEVKKRISDPSQDHLSLLGIGLSCGFKSKSSFNKAFKKHAGSTPSQYKASL